MARHPAVEPVRAVAPPRRPDPPSAESLPAAVELARLLRGAGYESGTIQARLATGDQLLARSPELPSYLRRLGDGDELAVLLRLLLLGVPVERALLDELVGRELRALLWGAGLLIADDGTVHGAARVVPHDELLIASDHAGAAQPHADHVPGVHRPSVALAHLTVRGEGERALDMGTGNGIQAILLAAHAARVVASDVSARALRFAEFNAMLNGFENIETREGSFFEPVEGEAFDLIVANPPYVVSPENAYLFRDGGMPGDAVSEQVVRTLSGTMHVQQALEQTGGFKKFRRIDVELVRPLPNGGFHKIACDYDRSTKHITPEFDYALLPGDRIVVKEDPSTIVDDMLTSALGPIGGKLVNRARGREPKESRYQIQR